MIEPDYKWSVEEIHSCPMFGGGVSWFYGFVENEGRTILAEVFPGMGYCSAFPLNREEMEMAWQDVRKTPIRKAYYVGARSAEQQEADYRVIQDEAEEAIREGRTL